MTKLIHKAGVSHTTILYTYDKDGREQTTKVRGGYTKTSTYDKLGRAAGVTLSTKKAFAVKVAYPAANGNQEHAMPSGLTVGDRKLTYQYDKNGNITRIQDRSGSGAVKTDTFCYDERNQLIREDSQTQNKTFVYEYDLGGNLTEVKEYAYTAGELPAFSERTETGSYASVWKDQLVNWNGTAMTYDAIGNMLTRGNITYRWIMGRKLAGVNNGKNIQYFYDHTGSRTKKVVDSTATEYRMAGELLVSEITNGQTFWYTYDSNANLVSIIIGGKNYFYVRNLQNDIIALIDEDGNTVVNYTYDSWGKILSITGSLKDTVGQQNPFRYRGYYYDKETGMYYLKNRYYDPELRRFISSDAVTTLIASTETLHNRNLYTYCNQNPLTRSDGNGHLWTVAAGIIGGVISLGRQLRYEKKEMSWKVAAQAALDGISAAVGASAVGTIGQIVTNVATTVTSGILAGDDGTEIAMQAAASGILASGIIPWVGGPGADFDGNRKFWKDSIIQNKDKSLSSRIFLNGAMRDWYVETTKKDLIASGISSVVGSGVSAGVSFQYTQTRGRHIGSGKEYRPGKKPRYFDIYDRNGVLYYDYHY